MNDGCSDSSVAYAAHADRRDALLWRLIRGEIRVKYIERFLEKRGYDDLHHSRWLQ